ncbi:MAG: SGNH/GDSL hydrolase family protein [Armatimonadota bacterium]
MILKRDATVVFIGDSITYEPGGYVAGVRELLQARIPKDPPTVINAGVNGDTVVQMLARFDRDVIVHDPHWVSIMAGVADTVWQMGDRADTPPETQGSEPAEFGETVQEMVERARDAGAEVALCTPTRFEENFSGDTAAGNRIIKQKIRELEHIARDQQLLLIPTGAVLHKARKDAAETGDTLHFTPDGLHPDAYGHSLMALAVLAAFGYRLRL